VGKTCSQTDEVCNSRRSDASPAIANENKTKPQISFRKDKPSQYFKLLPSLGVHSPFSLQAIEMLSTLR